MTDKKISIETTKTRTFKSPGEARQYARALAQRGEISKGELRGVERTVRAAEKSDKKR